MSNKNTATEIIRLSYTQSSYPGWRVGDKVPRPFTGPDGKVYRFKGLAVFMLATCMGNRIEVDIVHEPGVCRDMTGEEVA